MARWSAYDLAALKKRFPKEPKPIKVKALPKLNDIDLLVFAQAREAGWPEPGKEYVFAPPRKFRFDYCWPDAAWHLHRRIDFIHTALEVEGGVFMRGKSGHSSGTGILRDMTKNNFAVANGWRVLRLTPDQIRRGELLQWLKKLT